MGGRLPGGLWVRCSSVQLIIAQAVGEGKSPEFRLCGWNATKCVSGLLLQME
jgi:hypothetical protein